MEFGVQIFGCMPVFRQNPEAFFKHIARMGYKQIEPCLSFGGARIDGMPVDPLWSLIELDNFAKLAAAEGLTIDSCHAFGNLLENINEVKSALQKHGIKRLVINGPTGPELSDTEGFATFAKSLARHLKEINAELWIHNNDRAQTMEKDGTSWLEEILTQCGGTVGAQLDVGWALYSEQDPVEYMKKLGSNLRSVHYKDIKREYRKLPIYDIHTCLGEGCLDARPIYEYSKNLTVSQLIDQDKSETDIMKDLEKSVTLLKSF